MRWAEWVICEVQLTDGVSGKKMVGPGELLSRSPQKSLQFTFTVAEVLPFICSPDPHLGDRNRAVDYLAIGQRAVSLRKIRSQCHVRAKGCDFEVFQGITTKSPGTHLAYAALGANIP